MTFLIHVVARPVLDQRYANVELTWYYARDFVFVGIQAIVKMTVMNKRNTKSIMYEQGTGFSNTGKGKTKGKRCNHHPLYTPITPVYAGVIYDKF